MIQCFRAAGLATAVLCATGTSAQEAIFLSADGRASVNPDFADAAPIASDPDYGKVLAAPDDVDFNLSYARERASAGDLLGAASALERLLLNRPNWHAARLFYAAVLIRLDDLQAARRELTLLGDVPLSDQQKIEVARYTRQAARRDSTTRLSGQASVGAAYDSNAVGSLANAVNLGAGFPVGDDGLSLTAGASLGVATRLAAGTELTASLGAQSKTDISGPDQRYVRADASLGLGFAAGGFGVRVAAVARDTSIFGDHYEFDYGARIALTRRIGTRIGLTATLEVVDQDFDEPGISLAPAFGDGRDGTRIDGSIGFTTRLTARQTFALDFGYEDKDADYLPFAYRGPHASAAYSALLGRGSYVGLTGVVRRYNYRAADLLISPVRRRDTRTFARLALGAPLSAFSASGVTGDFRERLLLEGALSYNRRDSRAPFLDYDSVGAETRLIYRFGG